MQKEDVLKYLNANSEYRANINLNNSTDNKVFIRFDERCIYLYRFDGKEEKKLDYGNFNKLELESVIESLDL